MVAYSGPHSGDVRARVEKDYDPSEVEVVLGVLLGYHELGGFSAPYIQMAALRLANGRKELIQQWIDLANEDPRDLIMAVEKRHSGWWLDDYLIRPQRRD